MDKERIAVLKMAGYSVRQAFTGRHEWLLNATDDGDVYDDESHYYTDTAAQSWEDAWDDFLNRTKQNG